MKIGIRKIVGIGAVLVVMFIYSFVLYSTRDTQGKRSTSKSEDYKATSSENIQVTAVTAATAAASEQDVANLEKYQLEEKRIISTQETPKVDASSETSGNVVPIVTKEAITREVTTASKVPDITKVSTAAQKPVTIKVASRGSSSVVKPVSTSTPMKTSNRGNDVVSAAKQYLGKPYVYGAAGPSVFDCSGLTMYVYNKFGISLPHKASAQSQMGQYVPRSDLQPGDLIFFTTDGTGGVSHVGIYAGGGQLIQAPRTGETVSFASLASGYYSGRYITARRFVN